MSAHFFLTGTDTEIGKTTVSAALIASRRAAEPHRRRAQAHRGGAGAGGGRWVNEDVAQLHAVQNAGLTEAEVGPLQLRTPCAPPSLRGSKA